MSEPVLACRGLIRDFTEGGLSVQVLKGLDLVIEAGERVAIVGRSGSGKTTLIEKLIVHYKKQNKKVSVIF